MDCKLSIYNNKLSPGVNPVYFGINYKLNVATNYINLDVIYAKKFYRINPGSIQAAKWLNLSSNILVALNIGRKFEQQKNSFTKNSRGWTAILFQEAHLVRWMLKAPPLIHQTFIGSKQKKHLSGLYWSWLYVKDITFLGSKLERTFFGSMLKLIKFLGYYIYRE